jgi:transcriptional regulator of acetoin/glycerol metabolism
MLRKDSINHAGRVEKSVRHGALADGPLEQGRLQRSWQRSLEAYRLDPGRTAEPRILTAAGLRDHQAPLEVFLRIARHGVKKLHEQVRSANYVVLLTDASGVTIDFIGNPTQDRELKRAGLYLGSYWSESEEGTCGVGTSIVDGAPITVHKTEHFRAPNTTLTCSAAPIFDVNGKPLAILDASALYSPDDRDSQQLVLQFVVQSAGLIENAYFLDRCRDCWVLQLSPSPEFLQVQTDYLIACDDTGRIVAANRRAQAELVGARKVSAIGDLFELRAEMLPVLAASSELVTPLRALPTGVTYYARARGPERMRSRLHPGVSSGPSTPAAPQSAAVVHARTALSLEQLAGADPQMLQNVARIRRLVDANINILLLGETGTGKDVLARAIHDASARAHRPFVALNCAAIPESLIESELFGYREGAFTGARAKGMRGKLLQSDGGTLFLDEIGDMPLALQSRLLRVLADHEVIPLGGESAIPISLSVICATHRDLRALIQAGDFREDLFYRINGATFLLPALRNRADQFELMQRVLGEECRAIGRSVALSEAVLARMLAYHWPGNVRELRHQLRYLCAIARGERIELDELPPELNTARPQALADAEPGDERARITETLVRLGWNMTETARALGMSRATLYRKLHHYGITPPHAR